MNYKNDDKKMEEENVWIEKLTSAIFDPWVCSNCNGQNEWWYAKASCVACAKFFCSNCAAPLFVIGNDAFTCSVECQVFHTHR